MNKYLKKYVINIILIIQIISFIILASESSNVKEFIITKILAFIILYFNHNLLIKYTKIFEFERSEER